MKQNFTVRQGALDGVEAFLAVARHRNFRRAAADLGVTPSAVSQAIRAMEARIGAPLFLRTTRSVSLSEGGERFLARARPAFEELVAATQAARDLGGKPSGLLRVTVPHAAIPVLIAPLVASFCAAFPGMEVEVVASGELLDPAAHGFDAGVRLGQLVAADMVAVRLTPPFPVVVVAAPAYLRKRGVPRRIDDLRDHACLRLRRSEGGIASWSFANGNKLLEVAVAGPLIANDLSALMAGALAGMGLAQLPEPVVRAAITAGKLHRVLDGFTRTMPGMFLYYPGGRQMAPKLRAFLDHAKAWRRDTRAR